MKQVNVAIIGGGVIGTAIARELSSQMGGIVLFERMPRPGMMTSTRNSGVLHGGVYYPPESLKARFALPGNSLTQQFCKEQNVPMRNCGKLIVALQESEIPQLEKLAERGRLNGVQGLRVVGMDRIRELEPNITAIAALEVPTSCVVSTKELVKAYAGVASAQGVALLTESCITALEPNSNSITVHVERRITSHSDRLTHETFEARCVINAAGLYADDIAALIDGCRKYRIYPVRGEYARVHSSKANLVNGLVYPLPHNDVLVRDATSRRVHLTRTIEGDLLIGPTARYVTEKDDYENDLIPIEEFYRGILPLLPHVEVSDLQLSHSGIRPQLLPPAQQGSTDYIIERSESSARLINMIGMETPGLTAAPAIAQYIAAMVGETLS